MRCLSCNKSLSDREATRKYSESGQFIDLCDGCFSHVANDITSVESQDDWVTENVDGMEWLEGNTDSEYDVS